MYHVSVGGSIRRSLKKLPTQLQERLLRAAHGLARNPRPVGCSKLKGQGDLYRIRVGDYRIVYRIDDESRQVDITIVAHRREVYRDL